MLGTARAQSRAARRSASLDSLPALAARARPGRAPMAPAPPQGHPVPRGQRCSSIGSSLAGADEASADLVMAAMMLDLKRRYMELRPELRRIYTAGLEAWSGTAWSASDSRHVPVSRSGSTASRTTCLLDFGPTSVDGWLTRIIASELRIEDGRPSCSISDSASSCSTAGASTSRSSRTRYFATCTSPRAAWSSDRPCCGKRGATTMRAAATSIEARSRRRDGSSATGPPPSRPSGASGYLVHPERPARFRTHASPSRFVAGQASKRKGSASQGPNRGRVLTRDNEMRLPCEGSVGDMAIGGPLFPRQGACVTS